MVYSKSHLLWVVSVLLCVVAACCGVGCGCGDDDDDDTCEDSGGSPVVEEILSQSGSRPELLILEAKASNIDDNSIEYSWTATSGRLTDENANPVTWIAQEPGNCEISVIATENGRTSAPYTIEVKATLESKVFSVLDDATANEQTPSANYGEYVTVDALTSPDPGDEQRAYMRFDIDTEGMEAVYKAVLEVKIRPYNTPFNGYVYRAGGEWSEYNITWANKPEHAGGSIVFPVTEEDEAAAQTAVIPFEIDVTDIVGMWVNGTPNNGIIIMVERNGKIKQLVMPSKEDPTPNNRPQLTIQWLEASRE